MSNNNNTVVTFIKVSLITTFLFGGLLAQSYATTLFSNTIMKMNIEFSATGAQTGSTQIAAVTTHNEQQSSIAFGDHQLEVKSTFVNSADDAIKQQPVLAEINVQKLNETGKYQVIYQPSLLILRNEWAEIKLNSEDGSESIQLKMQFEDLTPAEEDNAASMVPVTVSPEWLNWGEESQLNTEKC